jgi:hypothetical protein
MHELYVSWNIIYLNLCIFSMNLTFLQLCDNFMLSSYSTKQLLDQIECILGFPLYALFECQGKGLLMKSQVSEPDDDRNRTCFFVR